MPYTQTQLDLFWSRFVTMREADVISVISPQSAAYEADFAAMLNFCAANHLYGFGDYSDSAASNPKFIGIAGRIWWGGPTRS